MFKSNIFYFGLILVVIISGILFWYFTQYKKNKVKDKSSSGNMTINYSPSPILDNEDVSFYKKLNILFTDGQFNTATLTTAKGTYTFDKFYPNPEQLFQIAIQGDSVDKFLRDSGIVDSKTIVLVGQKNNTCSKTYDTPCSYMLVIPVDKKTKIPLKVMFSPI